MKKLLKVLGILLLLLLALIIVLPFFLKGKIAEEIKKGINEQINAKVEFSDVSLSLLKDFPRLTLEIDSLIIQNLEPFEGRELARVNRVSTEINLLSAFGDNIKILDLQLNKPHVNILVLEDGRANYDIAKESSSEDSTESPDNESALVLELQQYSIVNGDFTYLDQSLPMRMNLEGLSHKGSGDFTLNQFVLTTETEVERANFNFDGIKYLNNVKSEIAADLDINLEEMRFTISENAIKLNELLLNAEGFIAMPEEDIDMDIHFSAPGSAFKELLSMIPAEFASDLAGVKADGSMAFSGFVKGTYNEKSMPGFGLDLSVENGRFQYPELPSSAENIQIKAKIDASDGNDFDRMTVSISQFHAELAQNPLDFQLFLANPISDPDLQLQVQTQLDLAKIQDIVPLEELSIRGNLTADFALDGRLSSIENERYKEFDASGQLILQKFLYSSDSLDFDTKIEIAYLNFSPRHIDLSQMKASIGQSNFEASGKINNYISYYFKDTALLGKFTFNADKINLNEFMTNEESATTIPSDSAEKSSGVIRLPEDIHFSLNSEIKELIYDNLNISNSRGTIHLREGKAVLEALYMELMQGSVEINGEYDSKPQKPSLTFVYNIKDFDINQTATSFNTVDKLAPIASKCEGRFSTRMTFKAQLDENMEPIEKSMEGRGTLQTKSVYVAGFEPLMKVAGALGIDRLSKQTIKDLSIIYKIQDGKAIVDPFDMELEGIESTVWGNTSFDGEMDYWMDMDIPFEKLPSKVSGQANKLTGLINDKLGTNLSAGTNIPVKLHITGTIENPNVVSDIKSSAKNTTDNIIENVKEEVKKEVQEVIDDTKEEALEKARKEADQILKKAQEEADQLVEEADKQAYRIRKEGYDQAQSLEDEANGMLEKAAAKVAAEKLRKETDKTADKVKEEARKKSDKIMQRAQEEADKKLKSVEQ